MTDPQYADHFHPVEKPSHYATGEIECWDAMLAARGPKAVLDYCMCCAFKYIWRAGRKDCMIQDLQKSIRYLEKAIEIRTTNPELNLD